MSQQTIVQQTGGAQDASAPLGMPPVAAGLDHATREIEVLVLDDSTFDLELLTRQCRLTDLPVKVTCTDTLPAFRRALSDRQFDVIFIDYILPEADGLAVCDLLRVDPRNAGAPVVMITNAARHDLAVAAMKSGCLDYLAKDSLSPETLRDLILRATGALGDAAREAMRGELELHRQEILDGIRALVREELGLARAGDPAGAVRELLIAQGLIAPARGDTDWSQLMSQDPQAFDFRKFN